MDVFVAGSFAVAAVVLFAAFGLAVPERRRPLVVASVVLVAAILVTQALVGLFGAQTARLTLFTAAFLGIALVGVQIVRRRQHG